MKNLNLPLAQQERVNYIKPYVFTELILLKNLGEWYEETDESHRRMDLIWTMLSEDFMHEHMRYFEHMTRLEFLNGLYWVLTGINLNILD